MNRAARAAMISAALFFAAVPALSQSTPGSLERRIQSAYGTLVDLQGEFRQHSRIRELDQTQEASGRFFIRRPGRLRWDYLKPSLQRVVIRDSEMFVRQEGDHEVLRGRFDTKAYGQTPMAILAGLGDLRKDFAVQPAGPRTLLLTPKKDMGIIQSIRLESGGSAFPIRTLQVVDVYGNVNTFIFENVKINQGLGDEVFVP